MKTSFYALLMLVLLGTSACSDSDNSDNVSTKDSDTSTDSDSDSDSSNSIVGANPDYFLAAGLAETITTTSCTLTDGTSTDCYKVVINGAPANADIGPFCPSTITDDATQGGIWFDGNGEVYNLEGQFFVDVKTLYGDDWELYDENTGEIFVTDTQVACEAAARPNVAEEYQNHCVECSISYYDGGMQQSILIPVTPVPLTNPESLGADGGGASYHYPI